MVAFVCMSDCVNNSYQRCERTLSRRDHTAMIVKQEDGLRGTVDCVSYCAAVFCTYNNSTAGDGSLHEAIYVCDTA
jgi:hypothetical protein